MKKITAVDIVKLNGYINSVAIDSIHLGDLLYTINTGKNRYGIHDVFMYLVDFVYTSLKENKSVPNSKFIKYIATLITIVKESNKCEGFIFDEYAAKINTFEELYINNRSITGKDGDESLIDAFKKLKELVAENLSLRDTSLTNKKDAHKTSETLNDSTETIEADSNIHEFVADDKIIATLKDQIALLESEVLKYKNAIANALTQSKRDGDEIGKLNKKIKESKQDIKELKKLADNLIKEKEELEKKLGKSNDKVEKLNQNIEEYISRITELEEIIISLNAKLQSLGSEVQIKDQEISTLSDALIAQQEKIAAITTNQDILDNFILEQLFIKKMSLDNILDVLLSNGFDVSKQDVLDSLKRINTIVNVQPVVGLEKKFGIVQPAYRSNQIIGAPKDTSKFDVVFLADYHYDGGDNMSYLQDKLDAIYNYCTKNGIDTVITLGDLIDDIYLPKTVNKQSFEQIKQFLRDFDKIVPYDANIKHLVLGGNHDRFFLKYGIDPIEQLAFEREDMISLGYTNAYMYFGNSDVIGLHHEGVPRESVAPDLMKSGDMTMINLKKAYENAKVDVNNRYFDLFGHFHKGRVDAINGFGIVPSLNADRNTDGAWHLTFYCDNNGRINYIVINSLGFKKLKEIRTNSETVYQKLKKQA